jgi:hypothetical protein
MLGWGMWRLGYAVPVVLYEYSSLLALNTQNRKEEKCNTTFCGLMTIWYVMACNPLGSYQRICFLQLEGTNSVKWKEQMVAWLSWYRVFRVCERYVELFYARIEFLDLASVKSILFWGETTCSLLGSYKRLEGIWCLHLQDRLTKRG